MTKYMFREYHYIYEEGVWMGDSLCFLSKKHVFIAFRGVVCV
jgi:hypothetical protein